MPALKLLVIVYGGLRQWMRAAREKIDEYEPAGHAIASYAVAVHTPWELYLEDRVPGESAKEWLGRTSS